MTTIAEKSATTGQLIADVATAATALAEWEDGDTAITNDQSTDGWRDNARVLHHLPSGQYVLLAIADVRPRIDTGADYTEAKGLRIHVSNSWDTTNNHPAGNTDTYSEDPWSADVGFKVGGSYDYVHYNTDNNNEYQLGPAGLWYISDRSGTRNDQASDAVTYFASVGASWLNIAAWNTTDGTRGSSSYYTFEHVDNKFWTDGNDPYAFYSQTNVGDSDNDNGDSWRVGAYGYKYWNQERINHNNNNDSSWDYPFRTAGFDQGHWGIVNPDANDDTFFFQRPVIYRTNNQTVPVAYIEDSIPNDTDEGGAHGDTVTHGGVTYQMFRQSGAANGSVHSVGLRYE